MKLLRFCLITAHYKKEVMSDKDFKLGMMHPQKAMKEMGITYQHATPQSMGDFWWFWNCESIPDKLPLFLSFLDIDPMECIGMGLSQENAESIRDFNGESK
jgi:hypothetical protein|tara:strand:+ start:1302 stop:1604 length:303 start_codon:yes stop_codon:yes gene_type:complete